MKVEIEAVVVIVVVVVVMDVNRIFMINTNNVVCPVMGETERALGKIPRITVIVREVWAMFVYDV